MAVANYTLVRQPNYSTSTREGGSAIIPSIYGTSPVLTTVLVYRTVRTVLVPYWYRTAVLVLLLWDSGSFWLEMSGADSKISTGHSSRTRQELGKPRGRGLDFASLRPLTEFQAQNCSGALGRPRGEIEGIICDPPRTAVACTRTVTLRYMY